MLNLFNKSEFALGLDIGDVSVRLIQLQVGKKGSKQVQAFTDKRISKKAFSGDSLKSPDLVIQAIREAVLEPGFGKITTKQVVASIPETKSFVRVIDMPAMSEEELREAIKWEAEQYIPLPIGQVYLDWVVLAPPSSVPHPSSRVREGEGGEKMKVLIIAAPRDYVDEYNQVLKKAGLRPVALEVESHATARSLVAADDTESIVMIVDINAERASFIIFDRGTLQFTSSLPIAGNAFTEAIAKALTIDFGEAEKIKRRVGLEAKEKGGKVRKALLPILNSLTEEIRNTIRFYEEHASDKTKISRLILTGGSSKLNHLPSYLSDKLRRSEKSSALPLRSIPGLKVELGNPWINVLAKGETPPISRKDSLSYATAIGLALRGAEDLLV